MKILLAHNSYLQKGGEDSAVENELRLLQDEGHEVIPYFRDNSETTSLGNLELAREAIWSKRAQRDVERLIHDEKPDLVHVHNTLPLISPSIYYSAAAAGVPVVQTLHNYRLVCPAATFLRDSRICEDCLGKSIPWPSVVHACYRDSRPASAGIASMLAFHRARRTYHLKVNRYIALTNFAKDKFVSGGLPEEKISVRGNFLSEDPVAGDGSGGYILYVGRLSKEKGVDHLISAWKSLGEQRLLIVGDGPLKTSLESQAAQVSNVEFLGHLPNTKTIELMKSAAALVLPSVCYEGFPMTIVEAFAVGTPVIASNLGSMAEIVEHGTNGLLFDPANPSLLAAAVRSLCASPELRATMRKQARRTYVTKHSPDAAYKRLMQIYASAIREVGTT